ncbi:MAG TPA: chemotaxis protein CheW [Anaerohalosphaeraceae bacterium]|nr:chemotaxis protein CheW [Anaerohalosphaeraceae bacterium]HOL89359.1 chemotaxis protein CheW [Anaerohalosphaeraceae bacterium]HPP56798.1 chemotaxis protein CheW [Anaerohalosphaeraceae bacterium]
MAVSATSSSVISSPSEKNPASEGKYLTFAIGNEEFGIEILQIREIIGYVPVTPVPKSPVYLKGILNLRGQVIPVIDLRLKFGMPEKEITDQTCIVIIETQTAEGATLTGLIVDRVSEVLEIEAEQIEPAPSLGSTIDTSFLRGIAKTNDSVKLLLEIDSVVQQSAEESI